MRVYKRPTLVEKSGWGRDINKRLCARNVPQLDPTALIDTATSTLSAILHPTRTQRKEAREVSADLCVDTLPASRSPGLQ